MSNHALAIQPANAQAQTQPAASAPKNQQAAKQTAAPQDKVTISESAKQALASNAKPAAKSDVNHDGHK
jgi:hypothetical protein